MVKGFHKKIKRLEFEKENLIREFDKLLMFLVNEHNEVYEIWKSRLKQNKKIKK